MRLKATVASLLAVLLLLTPCAASACQLKCDLGCSRMHPATQASHHMAGMAEMAQPAAPSLAAQHRCPAQVCALPTAYARALGWQQQSRTAAPLLTTRVEQRPLRIAAVSPSAETPPLAKRSPITLHTTLRV